MLWQLALLFAFAPQTQPSKTTFTIELSGGVDGRGLLMAECAKPVYRIQLSARWDNLGVSKGTLILDPTVPTVDEFGFPGFPPPQPVVKLDCTLKLIQKKTLLFGPAGPPPQKAEFQIFEITGPKIKSKLSVVHESGGNWESARFLVAENEEGKGRMAVMLHSTSRNFPPCHPGCFPGGTLIQIPGGTQPIEGLRKGDLVITIGPDGTAGQVFVVDLFTTQNLLFEVRTDGKTLTTTKTQPLALVGGGLRIAGDLKAKDQIYTLEGGKRKTVTVQSVLATDRQAQVFNLILGEPVFFVAGGFLARSKPLAPVSDIPVP